MKKTITFLLLTGFISSCQQPTGVTSLAQKNSISLVIPDTSLIPADEFGQTVKYGRELILRTSYYIGPEGVNGKYLGNKMNCTNCHQDAGTKPYSLNLMRSHERYPQYRPRENKVLTLAERINNCVTRPHSGKPLPHESKEMIAMLSYLKWINSFVKQSEHVAGEKNLDIMLPDRAASPERGANLYTKHCERCHGANGEGILNADKRDYQYPPLWGPNSYQPGSSMHRVIMQAKWLKANMPYDLAKWNKPVLTDEEALDIAAFVNDDSRHSRPNPKHFDYPNPATKPIDYDKGPFIDTFNHTQHKYGPWKPIIHFHEAKGLKPTY